METLRLISVYRKLGISISDIQKLLEKQDKDILFHILEDIFYIIFILICKEG